MIFSRIRVKMSHEGFLRYLKNSSWLFGGRFINLGISFFVSVYVTRYLGPYNNGLLSFAASFAGIFGFISAFGIDQILHRDLINHPEKEEAILGTAFFLKIIGSIYTIIIISVATLFIKDTGIVVFLILLNALAFVPQAFNVISYYFQSKVLSKYPTIISLLVIATLTVLKLYVVFFGKGVIYLSLIVIIEPILYAIGYLFIYKLFKGSVFKWKLDNSLAKEMLKYSWPLMISSAFISIYSRIDQVMIGNMLSTTSVGIYDVAVRLSEVWFFIPSIIASSLFPAILNAKKVNSELYNERLRKLYSLIFYLAIVIIIPVSILSPFIIKILYGDAFMAAAPILRIYSLGTISIFMGTIVNQYLIAENQTFILFICSFVGMATNVTLNLLLIPIYGIEGAAFATLVSYSLIPISIILFKKTRPHLKIILAGIF